MTFLRPLFNRKFVELRLRIKGASLRAQHHNFLSNFVFFELQKLLPRFAIYRLCALSAALRQRRLLKWRLLMLRRWLTFGRWLRRRRSCEFGLGGLFRQADVRDSRRCGGRLEWRLQLTRVGDCKATRGWRIATNNIKNQILELNKHLCSRAQTLSTSQTSVNSIPPLPVVRDLSNFALVRVCRFCH